MSRMVFLLIQIEWQTFFCVEKKTWCFKKITLFVDCKIVFSNEVDQRKEGNKCFWIFANLPLDLFSIYREYWICRWWRHWHFWNEHRMVMADHISMSRPALGQSMFLQLDHLAAQNLIHPAENGNLEQFLKSSFFIGHFLLVSWGLERGIDRLKYILRKTGIDIFSWILEQTGGTSARGLHTK